MRTPFRRPSWWAARVWPNATAPLTRAPSPSSCSKPNPPDPSFSAAATASAWRNREPTGGSLVDGTPLSLPLLRQPPQCPIQRSHVETRRPRKSASELCVRPPEVECVDRRPRNADRPQRSVIEDRVGASIAEVEDDRRGRPPNPGEAAQDIHLGPLIRGCQSDLGRFSDLRGGVGRAPGL